MNQIPMKAFAIVSTQEVKENMCPRSIMTFKQDFKEQTLPVNHSFEMKESREMISRVVTRP